MRYIVTILISILFSFSSNAKEVDASESLMAYLGESIEVVSDKEIHFCPDNTCDVYIAKNKSEFLASYVYLTLYHQNEYISVYERMSKKSIFRERAIDELSVREQVSGYCLESVVTPKCILAGLREKIDIKVCSGRYDQGYFCQVCLNEKAECKKL